MPWSPVVAGLYEAGPLRYRHHAPATTTRSIKQRIHGQNIAISPGLTEAIYNESLHQLPLHVGFRFVIITTDGHESGSDWVTI